MIISAAVKSGDKIFTGPSHSSICMHGERGFVTDTGAFLSRTEAAKHAYECGQVKYCIRFISARSGR